MYVSIFVSMYFIYVCVINSMIFECMYTYVCIHTCMYWFYLCMYVCIHTCMYKSQLKFMNSILNKSQIRINFGWAFQTSNVMMIYYRSSLRENTELPHAIRETEAIFLLLLLRSLIGARILVVCKTSSNCDRNCNRLDVVATEFDQDRPTCLSSKKSFWVHLLSSDQAKWVSSSPEPSRDWPECPSVLPAMDATYYLPCFVSLG